jgi:hypothetical protein
MKEVSNERHRHYGQLLGIESPLVEEREARDKERGLPGPVVQKIRGCQPRLLGVRECIGRRTKNCKPRATRCSEAAVSSGSLTQVPQLNQT